MRRQQPRRAMGTGPAVNRGYRGGGPAGSSAAGGTAGPSRPGRPRGRRPARPGGQGRSIPAAVDPSSERAAAGSSSKRSMARSTAASRSESKRARRRRQAGADGGPGADGAAEPPGGDGGEVDEDGAGVGHRPPVVAPAVELGLDLGGVLAGQPDLRGAEAVLQAVEAGGGGVPGACAELRVTAIRLDLRAGGHGGGLSFRSGVASSRFLGRRGRRAAFAPRNIIVNPGRIVLRKRRSSRRVGSAHHPGRSKTAGGVHPTTTPPLRGHGTRTVRPETDGASGRPRLPRERRSAMSASRRSATRTAGYPGHPGFEIEAQTETRPSSLFFGFCPGPSVFFHFPRHHPPRNPRP